MELFFDTPERRHLRPGDHIYVYRSAYLYSHHGIYLSGGRAGNGEVVDFVCPQKFSSRARVGCSNCEMMEFAERQSGVTKRCLDCFLNGGKLYRYRYGVSKFFYGLVYAWRLQGGTCNTAESGPAEVVIVRAEHLLRTNGFGEYHVFHNNCEDFATFCKTGQDCSRNGLACGQFGQSTLFGVFSRRRRH